MPPSATRPAPAAVRATPDETRAGAPDVARGVFVLMNLLLFGSGACALIYQVVWLRQLRLVFGASTQATAGVLAVFMGGIAIGSAWLAGRARRHERPLALYGRLELGIALGAAFTLPLQWAAARAYIGLGGTQSLGPVLGPAVQLLLAALVLGGPAVLMGGTLPAAVRAVEWRGDPARRRIAWIYGINTLGAVSGALLATFTLLERFGGRGALLLTVAVNIALALAALALARRVHRREPADAAGAPAAGTARDEAVPRRLLLGVGAAAGCVFFLMELVWYRMLGPLLGGSTYTFGLILAVALLGIGAGSALYALGPAHRLPTRGLLAATLVLEALGLAIPFALGDRLAVTALMLRAFEGYGFAGLVGGWSVVAACVVLPAAVVAGFQFPLLIALMRRGHGDAPGDAGALYAWNTAGAIAGSLAGGFGLIPLLTAPGVWRLTVVLLAALAAVVAFAGARLTRATVALVAAAAVAVVLVWQPMGPTAAWRHSGIGAGRSGPSQVSNPNQIDALLHAYRAARTWEADGRESAVGMLTNIGVSLIVGGKSDGNAVGDAGTQVMIGLLGAFLHPNPKTSLVVGLGTGSSAGWLAAVPSMERVDVVELEPAVTHVARACDAVNHQALDNPRLRLHYGDGRDVLLTSRRQFDIIASEPSNPYRAGIASLYTRELYHAAHARLAPGGIFLQWIQGYELDLATLAMVYATLGGEFEHVVTWAPLHGDLLLVASDRPIGGDVAALRARLTEEPFASAFRDAWRVTSLEGVLARFVGNDTLTAALAKQGRPNTDDNMALEYAFARHVGVRGGVVTEMLAATAARIGASDPGWTGGPIDRAAVAARGITSFAAEGREPLRGATAPTQREAIVRSYVAGDYAQARSALQGFQATEQDLTELAMTADLLADAGDPMAPTFIDSLARVRPAEALFLQARHRLRVGDGNGAADAFVAACQRFRTDPWTWPLLATRAFTLAGPIVDMVGPGERAEQIGEALSRPFAAYSLNEARSGARFVVAMRLDGEQPGRHVREALAPYTPATVPWNERLLAARAACLERFGDPGAASAARDLARYRSRVEADLTSVARSP